MSKNGKLELIMKRRAVLDLCLHLEKSSMETNDLIQQANSMEATMQFKVFKRCKEFHGGQTTIEHAKVSSCPQTVKTEIMMNMLVTLIRMGHS